MTKYISKDSRITVSRMIFAGLKSWVVIGKKDIVNSLGTTLSLYLVFPLKKLLFWRPKARWNAGMRECEWEMHHGNKIKIQKTKMQNVQIRMSTIC